MFGKQLKLTTTIDMYLKLNWSLIHCLKLCA